MNYGAQSDLKKARYDARTEQLFIESGYNWSHDKFDLEPFTGLAYTHHSTKGINEQGGAAALRGDRQIQSATVSTVRLRADTKWQVGSVALVLGCELGWQHQYEKLERKAQLMFRSGGGAFHVDSVPVSRDGAVLKVGADVAVKRIAVLSIGYGGDTIAKSSGQQRLCGPEIAVLINTHPFR